MLQVVLHRWQKLFCTLLLSLCQKVSCGILKEKEKKKKEKKERKREAAHVIRKKYSKTKLVKLTVPVNIQDNNSCIGAIVWNYTVREENKVQFVAFTWSLVVALNTNIQGSAVGVVAVGLLVGVELEACRVVPRTIFGRYSRTCICTLRAYTHHKCTRPC